jgi:hypothetical protein
LVAVAIFFAPLSMCIYRRVERYLPDRYTVKP